ncbi:hypothetical protein HQ529_01355 [Candidatus Woesearchaeota archaeon]|nr:hypothetical protein [Candidatus Woesearchaeota archaeon]
MKNYKIIDNSVEIHNECSLDDYTKTVNMKEDFYGVSLLNSIYIGKDFTITTLNGEVGDENKIPEGIFVDCLHGLITELTDTRVFLSPEASKVMKTLLLTSLEGKIELPNIYLTHVDHILHPKFDEKTGFRE